MNVEFKPIGDRVVVLPEPEDKETASGLLLPDGLQKPPRKGSVIAIGTGEQCKVGDHVYYPEGKGTEMKIHGNSYAVMRETEILTIIRETKND